LERVRRWYGLKVTGYVVMPEHVHLLISEPERNTLAVAIQMLKQITAQKLGPTQSRKPRDKGGAPTVHPTVLAHFIAFTCYHRYPHLGDPAVRDLGHQAKGSLGGASSGVLVKGRD